MTYTERKKRANQPFARKKRLGDVWNEEKKRSPGSEHMPSHHVVGNRTGMI